MTVLVATEKGEFLLEESSCPPPGEADMWHR